MQRQTRINLFTSDSWNVMVLAVVTALLFAPAIFRDDFHDLLFHTTIALDPDITRAASTGYPLFHMTVRALVMLCSIPPFAAGVLVATIAKLALAVSVYLLLRRPPDHITPAGPNSAFILSLVLCLLGPINLFTLPLSQVYPGYLSPNLVHNPTTIMMVPFALWESVMLGYLLVSPRPSGQQLSLAAVLVVLSSLAKPSFNLAAIPAFCLILLLQLVAKERSFWSAFRAGSVIVVPVVALSLMQFWLLFGRWSAATSMPSGVLLAPFAVLKLYSDGSLSLAVFKICASLGIPMVGLLLFRKSQHVPKESRTILLFCALTLVVALSQAVLFVEQSDRSISAGNLLWGASSALFITSFAVVLTLFDLELRPSQWFGQIGRPYRPMLLVLAFSVLGGLLVMRPLLPSNTLARQVRTMLFGH